jgi:hypothetical protein
VNDPEPVRRPERREEVPAQRRRFAGVHRAAGEPGLERLAGDQLHREVEDAVGDARLVHLHHVRVAQSGRRPGFEQESLGRERRRQLLLQRLDRDGSIEHGIPADEDVPHPARRQLPLQVDAGGECRAEPVEDRGHGAKLRCVRTTRNLRGVIAAVRLYL